MTILCNARVLNAPLTGIQRYTQEILGNLPQLATIRPPQGVKGMLGHAWEQTILPFHARGKLLWSPSNTGPIAVRHQVVTVHDLATYEAPEGFSPSFRAAYAFILPRLLPRVEGILTVSEFTKSRLIERFNLPTDKIRVTPLGVDHTRFYPRSVQEVSALRAKMELPEKFILFLGAMSARKNVGRLVQAWLACQNEAPAGTELLIAGGAGAGHVFDGTTLPKLPPRTRLLGKVADADLPALLSAATLFAFPSLYEGFGLPPLEAMACGTPCVVSNTTSLPEVAGAASLMVNPLDVEDIAAGLLQALKTETASRLKEIGLKHVQAFSWVNTSRLTLQALQACSRS